MNRLHTQSGNSKMYKIVESTRYAEFAELLKYKSKTISG